MSYIRISGRQQISAPLFLLNDFGFYGTPQAGTAKRVFLTPFNFPRPCMISGMSIALTTISAGKSVRFAIYRDNGSTPVGGALVYETGNLSAGATPVVSGAISVWLDAGNYWFALETEDAIMAFGRQHFQSVVDSVLDSCSYDLGAFGAFTNPCPAVTQNTSARVAWHVKVSNWS